MNEVRGMILAAGYGTRLAPVTDHVPKPLLPVDGVTLLDRIIEGFRRVGIGSIGLNTHHLGEMVAGHIARRPDAADLSLFPETEILGTGGALHGARDFLAGAPHFLLHNGDVLCDADLPALVEDHLASGALATLLLVDWPDVNSVVMAGDGAIASIAGQPEAAPRGRNLTYSGIGVFSRSLLNDIGPGFSSLIAPLVRALENDPGSVRGLALDGVHWSDLGTLARYLAAQTDGGASRDDGGLSLTRITGHGSDRKFWRLGTASWSAVAMVSPPQDEEFDRFVEVARFLGGLGLGSPALLSVSATEKTVLMEDLGTVSLHALVEVEGFDSLNVRKAYHRTVDRLLELQDATERAQAGCPPAVDRRLDYEALRWETDYFGERFLIGHLGMAAADLGHLAEEFHALAAAVAAQPRVLIHRDFQSQNILTGNDSIGLIDFQGMRLGPLGYDLASLIYDPYVAMPQEFRDELVDRFAAGQGGGDRAREIREMVVAAGLQRVMQALGAYGFLGHVKGKSHFLAHVAGGMDVLRGLLRETGKRPTEANPDLPGLTKLIFFQ